MTTNIRHALLAVSRPTVLLVVDGSARAGAVPDERGTGEDLAIPMRRDNRP
jgi:hypothetical protein